MISSPRRSHRARERNLFTGLWIGAIIGGMMLCAAIVGFWIGQAWPFGGDEAAPTAPVQSTVSAVESAIAGFTPAPPTERPTPTLPSPSPTLPIDLPTQPPATELPSPVPNTPAPPPAGNPALLDWPASLITGDLDSNYPLSLTTGSGRINIYYQPGSFTALNLDAISALADEMLAFDETQIGGELKQAMDLYIGGTLFDSNPYLQGYTQSAYYRSFVLIDGAYLRGETEYIIAHELAHAVSTHVFGTPSSIMLHEGLGTYLPQKYLVQDAGYLSHTTFCAVAYQNPPYFRSATAMARLGYDSSGFGGHVRSFIHYNLSACFVGHLVETYGMEKLREVYHSGDYAAVYGRPLSELDQEWQQNLAAVPAAIDGARFLSLEDQVAIAYERYFNTLSSNNWRHTNWEAYLHLVQARTALNQGLFDLAEGELTIFNSLMGF